MPNFPTSLPGFSFVPTPPTQPASPSTHWPSAVESTPRRSEVLLHPPLRQPLSDSLRRAAEYAVDPNTRAEAVMQGLRADCRNRFESKLAALPTGPGAVPTEATVHQAAAEAAYETIRAHYKGRLKSTNKTYHASHIASATPEQAGKMMDRNARQAQAWHQLGILRDQGAPLGAFLAGGVGNCSEMSNAAVALVHSLGLPALHGEFDTSPVSHRFGLVGGAAPWVIDPWAGVVCPQADYRERFRAKMDQWGAQGKMIFVVTQETNGDLQARKMLANDPAWLALTQEAGILLRVAP